MFLVSLPLPDNKFSIIPSPPRWLAGVCLVARRTVKDTGDAIYTLAVAAQRCLYPPYDSIQD